MKRSKQIALLLVGAAVLSATAACAKQETRQAKYKSLAACQADWPEDKGACSQAGGGVWHGPSYIFYRGNSYMGGDRIVNPTRSIGTTTLSHETTMFGVNTNSVRAGNSPAAVSARSGGFGSSAHGSSSGG